MDAVGTLHEAIASVDGHREIVHLDGRILADAAREQTAELARHGIVLGPRYYYEALPWLILLATRGLQSLAVTLRTFGLPPLPARPG